MTSLNHELAILSNEFDKNFMILNPDRNSFMLFEVKDKRGTTVADWCRMERVITETRVLYLKHSAELLIFP